MKAHFVAAMVAALTLGACAAGTDGGTAVDPLLGKALVAENGTTFVFNADGTVGGNLGGEEIVGTYSTDAREVCSTYSAPKTLTGREFCSVPDIDGDAVVFIRRDGSQSPTYLIEG